MRARLRDAARDLAGRWMGEQPIPIGRVARDRRVLRRELGHQEVGRVLVIGPALAVRQILRRTPVDVAGTSPHSAEVTVCSRARGALSLPLGRWDTIVVMEPDPDFAEQLDAIVPACRRNARLFVLDRTGWNTTAPPLTALAKVAEIQGSFGKGCPQLWRAEIRA